MENAKPAKCSKCQKEPTIHLTQVAGGKANKISMCSSCPFAEVAKTGATFDLMGQVAPDKKAVVEAFGETGSCPHCGLTSKNFKETGRLGCSRCYEAFDGKLAQMIAKLHKGVEHVGKTPTHFEEKEPEVSVEELRIQMEEHVAREEYEEAAVLRDLIREREAKSE